MDKDFLYREYVINKKSTTDIAKICPQSISTIRVHLKKHGYLRSPQEARKIAQPKMGVHLIGKKRVITDEWRSNMSKAQFKRWEGKSAGISLKPNGYYEITIGKNKGRSLHCVIMEIHIGRKLRPGEIVHHLNEIKTDNRIENLMLTNRSEHSRIHMLDRIKNGNNYDISKHSNTGEDSHVSKLKEFQVVEILKSTKTQSQLAEKYSVSKSCIKHIKNGRSWSHLNNNNIN